MFEIFVLSMSIYAISVVLVDYDGAFGIFRRLRKSKRLQSVLSCQVCTAFWVSLPFLLIASNPLAVLASYGLVIILSRNV